MFIEKSNMTASQLLSQKCCVGIKLPVLNFLYLAKNLNVMFRFSADLKAEIEDSTFQEAEVYFTNQHTEAKAQCS